MGVVTVEDVAAAQAEVDGLRAKFPPMPAAGDSPIDFLENAAALEHLQKLAGTPLGSDLRFAEKRRRELEVARSRQLAAIRAHEAAQATLTARMQEMTKELTASRQSLAKALNTGTLVAVEQAAKAHDDTVRRLAHELRRDGLHADTEDVQFDCGALADGQLSGLRIDGAWWLTCDPFQVGMWWVRGQLAAMHGQEFQFGRWLRDHFRLGMYDVRLDGLLDDVQLPKPAVLKPQASTAGRPTTTTPMFSVDAAERIDAMEADALRAAKPGHVDFIKAEASRMRQALPAHLQKGK